MDFKYQKRDEKNKVINLHAGHRHRMRQGIINNGMESLNDHQMLEFMLGYVLPRMDTNELAHTLINEFGSFGGVLDADIEDLIKIKGIKERSACFLASYRTIFQTYMESKKSTNEDVSSPAKVFDFIGEKLKFSPKEELHAIFVNKQTKVINFKKMSSGNESEVLANINAITTTAMNSKAHGVIIVHNHPNASSEPSNEDVEITKKLFFNLVLHNIYLIEHLIVGIDGFYSFSQANILSDFSNEYERVMHTQINSEKPKYN